MAIPYISFSRPPLTMLQVPLTAPDYKSFLTHPYYDSQKNIVRPSFETSPIFQRHFFWKAASPTARTKFHLDRQWTSQKCIDILTIFFGNSCVPSGLLFLLKVKKNISVRRAESIFFIYFLTSKMDLSIAHHRKENPS